MVRVARPELTGACTRTFRQSALQRPRCPPPARRLPSQHLSWGRWAAETLAVLPQRAPASQLTLTPSIRGGCWAIVAPRKGQSRQGWAWNAGGTLPPLPPSLTPLHSPAPASPWDWTSSCGGRGELRTQEGRANCPLPQTEPEGGRQQLYILMTGAGFWGLIRNGCWERLRSQAFLRGKRGHEARVGVGDLGVIE